MPRSQRGRGGHPGCVGGKDNPLHGAEHFEDVVLHSYELVLLSKFHRILLEMKTRIMKQIPELQMFMADLHESVPMASPQGLVPCCSKQES